MNVSNWISNSSDGKLSTEGAWEFEKAYNDAYWIQWFENYWKLSLILSTIYMVGIRVGYGWMKSRKRFELQGPLFIWNLGLAGFSIIGAFRAVPDIFAAWGSGGWIYSTLCTRDQVSISFEFWGLLFVLSKAVELGDTVFIVLRKQSLIFLHWYHHVTVLCYTWYTFAAAPSTSPPFGAMNYVIHSLMYSYYALKSIHFPVPRKVAMLITFLQLAQMVVGVGVNIYAAYVKLISGCECNVLMEHVTLALLMYGSYLVLFGNFFYKSYFPTNKTKIQ